MQRVLSRSADKGMQTHDLSSGEYLVCPVLDGTSCDASGHKRGGSSTMMRAAEESVEQVSSLPHKGDGPIDAVAVRYQLAAVPDIVQSDVR